MLTVPSSESVEVAVHRLAGSTGAPPLLIAHATGFHARCYAAVAGALADRFDCLAPDFRGHGATPVTPEWLVDWRRFGDDALAVARAIAPDGGLVGFGHSMGGAALLMAAEREPGLFERLVLFEPISLQPSTPSLDGRDETVTDEAELLDEEMRQLPIVQGALRRTRRFASFDAAYENFAAKPPLSQMVPSALRNYVDHGFREVALDDGSTAVELRCAPELEAEIFVSGRDNGVWALLPRIETPCVVAGGRIDDNQPGAQAEAIAARLTNATYVRFDEQDHFGPFSHPTATAELIAGEGPGTP